VRGRSVRGDHAPTNTANLQTPLCRACAGWGHRNGSRVMQALQVGSGPDVISLTEIGLAAARPRNEAMTRSIVKKVPSSELPTSQKRWHNLAGNSVARFYWGSALFLATPKAAEAVFGGCGSWGRSWRRKVPCAIAPALRPPPQIHGLEITVRGPSAWVGEFGDARGAASVLRF